MDVDLEVIEDGGGRPALLNGEVAEELLKLAVIIVVRVQKENDLAKDVGVSICEMDPRYFASLSAKYCQG